MKETLSRRHMHTLALHRILLIAGINSVSLFLPLFLYKTYDNNIFLVLLPFFVYYCAASMTIEPAMHVVEKIGIRKSLIVATSFLALSQLALFSLEQFSLPLACISAYIVARIMRASFYWVPYKIEMATMSQNKDRGKNMSHFFNYITIFTALLPMLGGFIISNGSFATLFVFSTVLVSLSIIPLLSLPDIPFRFDLTQKKLLKLATSRHYRHYTIANMALGIVSFFTIIMWPLYLFFLFEGEFTKIGIIATASTVVLIVLRWYLGRYSDKKGREGVTHTTGWLNASGWILKIFTESTTGIFLSDSYHKVSKRLNEESIEVTRLDDVHDENDFLDELTTLSQAALFFGGALGAGAMIVVLWITEPSGLTTETVVRYSFICAAIASLAGSYLMHLHHKN